MNLVKFIQTDSTRMSTIPIQSGQLIHCPDNRTFSFDTDKGERVTVADVIKVMTTAELNGISSPISGKIYLVIENFNLYTYYNSKWNNLSASPSNIQLSQLSQDLQTKITKVVDTCNNLSNNYYNKTTSDERYMKVSTHRNPSTKSWTQTTSVTTLTLSSLGINYKAGDTILLFTNGILGQPGYSYTLNTASGVITKSDGGSWGASQGGDYMTIINIPSN